MISRIYDFMYQKSIVQLLLITCKANHTSGKGPENSYSSPLPGFFFIPVNQGGSGEFCTLETMNYT